MSQSRHHHLPGQIIHGHVHDEHQLVYIARGVLAIHTVAGAWVASSDRAIWIPAGIWHEHKAHGDVEVHTLMFSTTMSPSIDSAPTVLAVRALLRELIIACTEPGLGAKEVQHLRAVIGDRMKRADIRALMLPNAQDARLADACRLVTDDLSEPRTVGWLATQTGTSERTLARLFSSEFGTTYPRWRTNVRVFQAMIELSGGATVTETAHLCGWATTSAFVDTFTRTMGKTPGTFKLESAPNDRETMCREPSKLNASGHQLTG